MAPTSTIQTPLRNPQSKHRLHFTAAGREASSSVPTEHPVEVISRIRDHSDPKSHPLFSSSSLEVSPDNRSIRVRTEIGYRDFSLDGVSFSESEDLEGFYRKYVGSRIEGVRMGAKCTIMMYGPTGSGKSHTMFGCSRQPGIVYRALRDILGEGCGDEGLGMGLFVQVAVLEIYNEEIYDLLSGNVNPGLGLPKPNSTPKVRLEVMGKKAKNATFISGTEAGKISREVAKVEKRRIVKSTNCNERSSRSHCMIILDVPSVGGRLMLVDMAGSENIDQAGQTGFEAKMQTAKINQGNIALKRVVESIANSDSHVPFRDSKLTMLLQDSFEDDKSKILMILCASPDPREMHKTISTLEYGAKAKCIVRAAHMPTPKDKMTSDESSTLLRSRIEAMNQFIYKLQMENKIRKKEHDEAQRELVQKDEEILELKSKVKEIQGRGLAVMEQEINSKVDERTQKLRLELMKMEEHMLRQQEELCILRQRLEEVESQRSKPCEVLQDADGGKFAKRLSEIYAGEQGMEKSMELDTGDQPAVSVLREIKEDSYQPENYCDVEDVDSNTRFTDRVYFSTVFEQDGEEEGKGSTEGYEVDKEVVQESTGSYSRGIDGLDYPAGSENNASIPNYCTGDSGLGCMENFKDSASNRKTRIHNIFRLCGNYRELSRQVSSHTPPKQGTVALCKELDAKGVSDEKCIADLRSNESPISSLLAPLASLQLDDQKENCRLEGQEREVMMMDIYVKWEASKVAGNFIKKLKVLKNSTLSDLRKLIEAHLEEDNKNQSFAFLLLGDPSGAPVTKDKEGAIHVTRLPIFNNQMNGHLACLRPIKISAPRPNHVPFGSLENTIQITGHV